VRQPREGNHRQKIVAASSTFNSSAQMLAAFGASFVGDALNWLKSESGLGFVAGRTGCRSARVAEFPFVAAESRPTLIDQARRETGGICRRVDCTAA